MWWGGSGEGSSFDGENDPPPKVLWTARSNSKTPVRETLGNIDEPCA
jgi:hypothetical protein